MFRSQGKELDEIGGPSFSRPRQFDDEARKARIFDPNAYRAVDVDALHSQVEAKNSRKQLEEEAQKEFDFKRASQLHAWSRSDEELRQSRIEERRRLEETWKQQHDQFNERWKKQVEYPNANDPVYIIPMSRYRQQDEEPVIEAQKRNKTLEVRAQQVQEVQARKEKEMEDYWAYENYMEGARYRLKKREEELQSQQRQDNVMRSEDYMEKAREKAERERRIHDEDHNYQIHRAFFDQFGTTSR